MRKYRKVRVLKYRKVLKQFCANFKWAKSRIFGPEIVPRVLGQFPVQNTENPYYLASLHGEPHVYHIIIIIFSCIFLSSIKYMRYMLYIITESKNQNMTEFTIAMIMIATLCDKLLFSVFVFEEEQ